MVRTGTIRKRRGVGALELLLTLPILMFLLFGLFEFAMLFHARSAVVEASRVGARMASVTGAQAWQVEQEVRRVLPPGLEPTAEVVWTPGRHSGDAVVVGVRVPMMAASPDLLWPVGFSLWDQDLYAETVMVRE